MGGVDIADQLASTYSFLRKSLKWWRKIFFGVLKSEDDWEIFMAYLSGMQAASLTHYMGHPECRHCHQTFLEDLMLHQLQTSILSHFHKVPSSIPPIWIDAVVPCSLASSVIPSNYDSRSLIYSQMVHLRLHFVIIRKVLASKVPLECWIKIEVAWGKFRRIRKARAASIRWTHLVQTLRNFKASDMIVPIEERLISIPGGSRIIILSMVTRRSASTTFRTAATAALSVAVTGLPLRSSSCTFCRPYKNHERHRQTIWMLIHSSPYTDTELR
ncbi:hypothetical protein LAZ67_10000407 [Cordylochernes scorpioides]|uniref:Maturase K n=1 Tax=Cordylochernes scorpioides TaxID=51811 RepID=A0ABY6KVM2_9ARAC|nr:hypothetical protein LAZ67_10000407 [Cordylochernes scorpioides]